MAQKARTARKKRPAKILVRKGEPVKIGDKLVRSSKRAVLTITNVDNPSGVSQ